MRWRRVRRAGARMPSLSKFVARMLYWCDEANLGYDQGNRWDIRPGGECDCSSLVIHALREAGFTLGRDLYDERTLAADIAAQLRGGDGDA